ncbi:L-asparaginase [Mycolicibacterium madagascariense]|uniref:asparaginase n=1 Tax=Mycolicibacterium madagascariense TaxID=212765 RepID=A0A7I7XIK7_9MYCO|nr:asparaginase [Mycolicibacterium madagascariense]MCV7011074.1 asparaginase [Mycolicibacterium madagascariense]BBZ29028.1 L-asparaginase [Mycolicibacterium madagascariense]
MPRVVVLATGGTISSRRAGGAVTAVDDAATTLAGVAMDGVAVEHRDVLRIGSYRMTLADARALAEEVERQLHRVDVDGVVVTHGTDTMEETAILLDLVRDGAEPVVLTGAQRAADAADADGPRNLRDAITVAADPAARGRGALVVFGGSVWAARGVRKSHTVDLSAFTNPAGAVGGVHSGTAELQRVSPRPAPLALPTADFDSVRVDVVTAYLGSDDVLLRAAVAAGARGIVLAALGTGNAPPGVAESVAEICRAGVVVALSTRAAAGPIVPIYGAGGGVDLVAAGAVPVALPAPQARVAMALLLSSQRTAAEVVAALDVYA